MAVFLAFIALLGWLFSYIFDSPAIFYLAVLLSVGMNVWSFWFSDKLVLAMTKAKEVSFEQNPELHRVVENIAITAGLPKPRIYLVNEPQPNAFATGRDPKHGVVAVTTGLLQQLERSELEGVLAHEMAHIGNRDILVSTIAVVLAGAVAIISDMFLRSLRWGGSGNRRSSRDAGGAIFLVLAVIAAILAPIAASLIRLAVSRKREFLADATGALITRYPEGLARALERISSDENELRVASNSNAHLWIADPARGQARVSWMVKLFMTHPPIAERAAALRGMRI